MLKRLFCLSLSIVLSQPALAVSTQLRFQETGARRCGGAHVEKSEINQSTQNTEELRSALQELRDLVAGKKNQEAKLDIRDLPMWSKVSKQLVRDVQQSIKELGLEDVIDVTVHYVPTRKGIAGGAEKLRYLFPMRQDFEKPISDEVRKGGPGVIVAESTASLYAILAMPPESALPLLLSHFTLLATRMAYQKTLANWNMRSGFENSAARVSEGLFKELLLSSAFIFNYKVSSSLPDIYRSLQQGAFEALGQFSQNAGQFAVDQGLTSVIQTGFFYLTFQRGGFRWMKLSENDPYLAEGSRRAMSILTPATFMVSGPMLMWASTSKAEPLITIANVGLNGGQVGLLALTALGSIVAYNPRILNPTVPVIDRYVHGPLNRMGERIRDRYRALRNSFF